MTKFQVQWDQWYRCGHDGDDKDYDHMVETFETMVEAQTFVDELVAGEHRSRYDLAVYHNEVTITEK